MCMHPFIPTSENIIYVGFIYGVIIPNVCVSGSDVLDSFGDSFLY